MKQQDQAPVQVVLNQSANKKTRVVCMIERKKNALSTGFVSLSPFWRIKNFLEGTYRVSRQRSADRAWHLQACLDGCCSFFIASATKKGVLTRICRLKNE